MPAYSKDKVRRLLNESDEAPNSHIKGDKLEQLVRYLFEKIPSVKFSEKNILDGPRAHEIDLAFWHPDRSAGLCFLDPLIIVECKNHTDPLSSSQVGWFIRKLQDRGANHGILVSLSGITGSNERQNSAHSEIIAAQSRDRIKVFLITREEILTLGTSDDLVEILTQKYMKLALRRIVYTV